MQAEIAALHEVLVADQPLLHPTSFQEGRKFGVLQFWYDVVEPHSTPASDTNAVCSSGAPAPSKLRRLIAEPPSARPQQNEVRLEHDDNMLLMRTLLTLACEPGALGAMSVGPSILDPGNRLLPLCNFLPESSRFLTSPVASAFPPALVYVMLSSRGIVNLCIYHFPSSSPPSAQSFPPSVSHGRF